MQADKIKKGMFYQAEIYKNLSTVILKPRPYLEKYGINCYDKECLWFLREMENVHIPKIQPYKDGIEPNSWIEPLYKPLSKENKRIGRELTKLKYESKDDYEFIEKVYEKYPQIGEAIDEIYHFYCNYCNNLDQIAMEFNPSNLAEDADGNLILLDIVFDRSILRKIRQEKEKKQQRYYF